MVDRGWPIAMQIAREGYPFILTAVLLALFAFVLGWKWLGLGLALFSLGFVGFFRDPERTPPKGDDLILSPADGRIVGIRRHETAGGLEGGTQVSIFLSPLDVHVNRAPVKGRVEQVEYQKGRFLAAYKEQASQSNEQNMLSIVDPRGRSLRLVQIAGVLARRIVCYVKRGDGLERGQRFGLIMFGSRVDLFLPPDSKVEVVEGQKVRGGETIVGRFS
ncbi:MAG: phosphatidylserine decarboxylase family protein [Candidatus Binatia bacterium]